MSSGLHGSWRHRAERPQARAPRPTSGEHGARTRATSARVESVPRPRKRSGLSGGSDRVATGCRPSPPRAERTPRCRADWGGRRAMLPSQVRRARIGAEQEPGRDALAFGAFEQNPSNKCLHSPSGAFLPPSHSHVCCRFAFPVPKRVGGKCHEQDDLNTEECNNRSHEPLNTSCTRSRGHAGHHAMGVTAQWYGRTNWLPSPPRSSRTHACARGYAPMHG